MRLGVLTAAALLTLGAGTAHAAEPGDRASQVDPGAASSAAEDTAQQIADGVTVAGVEVGGMTAVEAESAVSLYFDRPLEFVFKRKRWRKHPGELAKPRLKVALSRALDAAPGEAIDLPVAMRGAELRRYVAFLDRRFSRPAREAKLRGLKKFRPSLTKPRKGLKVARLPMMSVISETLRRHDREPISLEVEVLEPRVTLKNFGSVIVIRRFSKNLYLYDGQRFRKRFPVATGQLTYPTPLGRFSIVVKARHPWWIPPNSDWAEGLTPIPPGPGNPLGTRWMGISAPGVGIHGTPDAASIGYSASHGCVRMHIPHAEWLFTHIDVGTPVFIVNS